MEAGGGWLVSCMDSSGGVASACSTHGSHFLHRCLVWSVPHTGEGWGVVWGGARRAGLGRVKQRMKEEIGVGGTTDSRKRRERNLHRRGEEHKKVRTRRERSKMRGKDKEEIKSYKNVQLLDKHHIM